MNSHEFFCTVLPKAEAVLQHLKSMDTCCCTDRLSDEEIRSIYFYSTEHDEFSYKNINKLLEQGSAAGSKIALQVEKIDSGLSRLAPYAGQCLRGEDEGGYIHKKATEILKTKPSKNSKTDIDSLEYLCSTFFMSTTVDVKSMHLKRNVKIFALSSGGARNISHLSACPDEQEMLFQRGSKFLLTQAERLSDGSFSISLMEV